MSQACHVRRRLIDAIPYADGTGPGRTSAFPAFRRAVPHRSALCPVLPGALHGYGARSAGRPVVAAPGRRGEVCRCGGAGRHVPPFCVRRAPARFRAARSCHAVRRSSARYIASVPCRCGHSCTSGPSPRSGTPGSRGRASIHSACSLRRTPALQDVVHDRAGLRQVRRAGRVADDPADPRRPQRLGEQGALERGEPLQVLGAPPPPGLGAAAQGAEARARHVHQDPVEGSGPPRRARAVGGDHLVRSRGCRARARSTSPARVRLLLGERAGRRRARGERAQEGRLATGSCAPVQPARVGAVQRRTGQGDGHELAALVLDARPSFPHGVERAGLPPSASRTAYGDQRPGSAASPPSAPTSSSVVDRPGRATRVTSGRSLSAASRSSMPARPPPSASHRAETTHRGWECTTARWSSGSSSYGGATRSSQPSRSSCAILRSIGVDELARPSPSTTGPARRSPRRRRAWGCASRAAGARRGTARPGPAGPPRAAAGRRRRR